MNIDHSKIEIIPDKKLRDYQQKAKSEILHKWNDLDSLMLQMPTGTGKTVIFASIIRSIYAYYLQIGEDANILAVVHRKELVEQIGAALAKQKVPYGIIQGNTQQNLSAQVQVASIYSILSKKNKDNAIEMDFKYIIVDEAHHSLAKTYVRLFRAFPNAKKLGVTATPWRLNHEPFTSLYQDIIVSPPIKEFIKRNYLADYIYISIKPDSHMQRLIDQTDISITGDFDERMLEWRFDQQQIRAKLLEAYRKYANGRKGIIYAINKEHAKRIAALYSDNGYSAVEIDCDTPKILREYYINQFKAGTIQILVNVQIFTEGFDCPDIEFIQLARPTRSLALYLQQVGRGLRPVDGKDKAIILDNVGLFNYFGLPDANRKWRHHFLGDSDFEDAQLIKHRSSYTWFSSYERDYSELDEEMIIIKGDRPIDEELLKPVDLQPSQMQEYTLVDFPKLLTKLSKDDFVSYLNEMELSGKKVALLQDDFVRFVEKDSNADSFWNVLEIMSIFNPRYITYRLLNINYGECDSNIFNQKYKKNFLIVLSHLLKADDKMGNVIRFVEIFSCFEDEGLYDKFLPYIHSFSRPEYYYHFWSLKSKITVEQVFDSIKDHLTLCGAFSFIEVLSNNELKHKFNWNSIDVKRIYSLVKHINSDNSYIQSTFAQLLKSKLSKGKYGIYQLDRLVKQEGFEGFSQFIMKRMSENLSKRTVSQIHNLVGQTIEVKVAAYLDNHYYVEPKDKNINGIMGLLPYVFSKKDNYTKLDVIRVKVTQYNRLKKLILVKEIDVNMDIYSIPVLNTGSTFKLTFSQNPKDRIFYPVYKGIKSHLDFNIINYNDFRDKKKKYTVCVVGQQNYYRYILKIIGEITD